MSIKTIPLSQLEANPRRTLIECAESGDAFVIELPEQRFAAIQTIAAAEEDDSFTSDLLESNAAFTAGSRRQSIRQATIRILPNGLTPIPQGLQT